MHNMLAFVKRSHKILELNEGNNCWDRNNKKTTFVEVETRKTVKVIH